MKAAAQAERKRKRAEALQAVDDDKENANPNVPTVARALPKPVRYECTVVKERRRVLLRLRKSE